MAILALLYCCGIIFARFIYLPLGALYISSIIFLLLAFVFLRKMISIVLVILLIINLGSLSFLSRRIPPNDHIARITPDEAQDAILTGIVSSYPQPQTNFTSFLVEARQLVLEDEDYKVKGNVLVKIFKEEDVAYGQMLQIKGKISKPYTFGSSQYYREYLKSQGIYTVFAANKLSRLECLGSSKGNVFKALAFKLRHKANSILFKHIPFTQAALLSAMILGDRSSIPGYLNKMFIQTGTVHMLAISGFNVGIVAMILELILRSFRIKRRARHALLLFALLFYCVLTGACAPVVRSTIMAAVFLATYFLKREVSMLHSLSLAAMIILAVNPAELFDVGFQLSFLSILAIMYISPFLKRLLCCEARKARALRLFFELLCTSAAAFLGLLPFIACYFKVISPVTVLANIIVVPYVSLVTILGIIFLLISVLLPCAAGLFALPASLSVVVLFAIIRFFNGIPFGYFYLR
jgi:competence protein ComEC